MIKKTKKFISFFSNHKDMSMEIDEAQKAVDDWIKDNSPGYWDPLSMLARLTEEVGELARELNDKYGEKDKKVESQGDEIVMEIGDILFVLICISNSLDIKLDEALGRAIGKYNERDKDRWVEEQ